MSLLVLATVALLSVLGFEALRGDPASDPEAADSRGAEPIAVAPARTVAVLPLTLLGDDRDQALLGEAFTDALTTQLACLDGPRVVSRSSVSAVLEEPSATVAQIARRLGVDALVEGSVQREGGRICVRASLVDPQSGTAIWAEDFEQDGRQALAIQRAVAESRAARIARTLSGDPDAPVPAPSRRPSLALDAETYDQYVCARSLSGSPRRDQVQRSLGLLDMVVERAPTFADAYVVRAQAFLRLAELGMPPERAMESAREAAERGLTLEPSSGAHGCLAELRFSIDWDFDGAEQSFLDALEINPSDTRTRSSFATFLCALSRHEEALVEMDESRRLDPCAYPDPGRSLALAALGRLDQALHTLEGLAADAPEDRGLLAFHAPIYGSSPSSPRKPRTGGDPMNGGA